MENQAKKIGVFLDNAAAKLMEYNTEEIVSTTIESKFTHEAMIESLEKSENIMHNKKRQQQNKLFERNSRCNKKL